MCYNSKKISQQANKRTDTFHSFNEYVDFKTSLYSDRHILPTLYDFGTHCGYCRNCRLKKRRDWIVRNHFENLINPISYVFCLTYSESPIFLNYSHLQDFNKRLRYYGYNFRFFSVGEYGELFGRPHFHVSYYGFPKLIDLYCIQYKSNGYHIYTSDLMNKIWGYGIVRIQIADGDSSQICYTTLYSTKNQSMSYKRLQALCMDKFQISVQELKDYNEAVANGLKPPNIDKITPFKKFLNSVKEKNTFSLSLGWAGFQPYLDSYIKDGYQYYIDGYPYHIPTSWLQKYIRHNALWAQDHLKQLKEDMPCIDDQIAENKLKGNIYLQSSQYHRDLQEDFDNKVL